MGSDLKRKIFKTVGYIPVIICLALLGWSYYAYNIVFCFDILPQVNDDMALRVVLVIISHILLFLCVWSYIKVVFVHPGKPDQLSAKLRKLNEEEQETSGVYDASNPIIEPHQIQKVFHAGTSSPSDSTNTISLGHHMVTVKNNGEQRFCRKCDFEKPDRTHHCSICDECILKMDHHCPWVNNCVGFHNQKFFLLFIFYTSVYCLMVAATLIPGFVMFTKTKKIVNVSEFQLVFLSLLSVMFGIILLCFTGYNGYLLLTNRTTIENMELTRYKGDSGDSNSSKTINVFNIGYKRNFQDVMGKSPYLWLIPVDTTLGDGILFPLSSRAYNLLSSRD